MQVKNIKNYIADLLLTTFMSFSLVYAMTTSLVFDYNPLELFCALLAVILIFSIIFLNKVTVLVSGSVLAALTLVSGIIYLSMNHGFTKLINAVKTFAIWTYDYITGYDFAKGNYTLYLTILICIFVPLLVFIFTHKKYSFPAILVLGSAIFVIQWAYGIMMSLTPFYLFVILIVIYYFKHIYIKNSNSEANDFVNPGAFTVWILPVSIIVFLLALTITNTTKPFESNWLNTKVNAIITYVQNMIPAETVDYFSVSSTGFGEGKGRLGGKVRLDNRVVLEVQTPRKVYLKGASCDTYTGTSWLESDNILAPYSYGPGSLINNSSAYDSLNNIGIDFTESTLGSIVLDENSIPLTINKDPEKKHVYRDEIKIIYLNLNLKSLFLPLKTVTLNIDGNNEMSTLMSGGDVLSLDEKKGNGFSYAITSYNFDYSSEYIRDLLRKSRKGLYREYASDFNNKYTSDFYSEAEDPVSNTSMNLSTLLVKLAGHSDVMHSRYLQLPESLPERVKTLSADIASKFNNNYDKVKAVENYLANNYPYTLNPGRTPKESDFVDHFLFEQKKGYCTYYASAMTVMVRSLGIPARYVEGYILPPDPLEDSSTTYHVTNEQAHAWVEVYFEGFGWVPFEPTSPFTTAFYEKPEVEASFAEGFMDDAKYLEYYKQLGEYGGLDVDFDRSIEGSSKPVRKKLGSEVIILALLVMAAASLIFIMLFNFSRSKVKLYNFRKLDPRESVLAMFKYYFKVLSLQGCAMSAGETPSEYSHRISDQFLFERFGHKGEDISQFMGRVSHIDSLYKQSKFASIMEVFVKARYSLDEISDDEKQHVYSYTENLKVRTKENIGKLKYFAYKFLLGWL